jgi:alkylhydroperoxidase/carboxymuconolactone decarboxylase family protein YurZ
MTDEMRPGSRHAELEARYGRDLVDHPPLISRERWLRRIDERDALDRHFARISLEFSSRLIRRDALDVRLRALVQIGMFTVSRSEGHLEDAIDGAIDAGVPIREILEAIFLTHVYAGDTVVEPALAIFHRVATRRDALGAIDEDALPIDRSDRDFEQERATWSQAFRDDPRLPRLIDTYGWQGVSTGYRFRGVYHLDSLEYLEDLDVEWGKLWESMIYEGLYSRGYLDDKTRLLCTVGDCIALGATGLTPVREHMREALEFGSSPRELLEIAYMAGLHLGMPLYITVRGIFVQIMADLGRLAEIGDVRPPKAIDERR